MAAGGDARHQAKSSPSDLQVNDRGHVGAYRGLYRETTEGLEITRSRRGIDLSLATSWTPDSGLKTGAVRGQVRPITRWMVRQPPTVPSRARRDGHDRGDAELGDASTKRCGWRSVGGDRGARGQVRWHGDLREEVAHRLIGGPSCPGVVSMGVTPGRGRDGRSAGTRSASDQARDGRIRSGWTACPASRVRGKGWRWSFGFWARSR